MALIELTNVSKTYKHNTLFADANLSVEAGKTYGLIGPNGSGKSVLFRLICGFLFPDAGTVTIDPRYKPSSATFPRDFGVIIDRPGYLPQRNGLDNLTSLAAIRGLVGEPHIKETMKKVGLNPDLKTRVSKYSLGMKQKLSIAQAIMENQEVLILDEPFNALDSDSVKVVRRILSEHRDEGGTILFTSHNSEDIQALSDHVWEINNGTVQQVA